MLALVETPPIQYVQEQAECPCCGARMSSDFKMNVGFDYTKNRLFGDGLVAHLYPMEADAINLLMSSWPNLLSNEDMIKGLYGQRDVPNPVDTTRVMLSKLRKKIRPLGLEIKNVRDRGYFLAARTDGD